MVTDRQTTSLQSVLVWPTTSCVSYERLRVLVRRCQDVQSFVLCRLDYCNALLYGISGGLIQRLQSVQNAAARLVTGARRRDHITSVLRQLHWLPVKQRIDFKLTLHGLALPYLSDDCQLVTEVGRRHLRSSDVYTYTVYRAVDTVTHWRQESHQHLLS